MSNKKKRLYNLKAKTVETIEAIEADTGLKKSTIVDKAIEAYNSKKSNEN